MANIDQEFMFNLCYDKKSIHHIKILTGASSLSNRTAVAAERANCDAMVKKKSLTEVKNVPCRKTNKVQVCTTTNSLIFPRTEQTQNKSNEEKRKRYESLIGRFQVGRFTFWAGTS